MGKQWVIDPNTCKFCEHYEPEKEFEGLCSKRLQTVPFDDYCESHEIGDEFMFDKDLFNPKLIKR